MFRPFKNAPVGVLRASRGAFCRAESISSTKGLYHAVNSYVNSYVNSFVLCFVFFLGIMREKVVSSERGDMQTKPKRIGWITLPYLQAWRAKYEWSQDVLAKHAQISRATISSAEQGNRLSFKAADSIAKAFGVDRARLMEAPDEEEEKVLVHA
jgi:DNA-binding XRE family transcriptional regulator